MSLANIFFKVSYFNSKWQALTFLSLSTAITRRLNSNEAPARKQRIRASCQLSHRKTTIVRLKCTSKWLKSDVHSILRHDTADGQTKLTWISQDELTNPREGQKYTVALSEYKWDEQGYTSVNWADSGYAYQVQAGEVMWFVATQWLLDIKHIWAHEHVSQHEMGTALPSQWAWCFNEHFH